MANTNGESNDHQYDGDNGTPVDDMEHNHESESDEDGDSGPAADAGVDETAEATKADRKKFKLQEVKKVEDTAAAIRGIRASEPDLVKRAKALKALQAFEWPVVEQKQAGGMVVVKPVSCDQNRMYALEVLFGKDDEEGRPHVDTFRGRFVDHVGKLVDDRYSMKFIIEAMRAAGLEAQPIDGVRKAFKEWAMVVQTNDLIKSFEKRVPQWDGKERLGDFMVDLFALRETELNKQVDKYFWLSLYNRVMQPGCLAPIVISLFGAQNAGKSRFSKEIVRAVLNNEEANSVQLNLGGNKSQQLEFLRSITGNSVIANVGEMTGFTRGDLNDIKDFVTQTSDKMHYKYEGTFDQQRQWVTVLDGNKYEGLQRDDTGNRRFYPMFLGQLPDKDGKPHWQEGFQVDFTGFREHFWQVMAECREWMNTHTIEDYNDLVNDTAKKIFAFSNEEMRADRGTIRDDALDTFLIPALRICELVEVSGTKIRGVLVTSAELQNRIAQVSRNRCNVNAQHLVPKMNRLGAEKKQSPKYNNYYLWKDYDSVPALREFLNGGPREEGETEKIWSSPKGSSDDQNGGF